MINKGVFTVMFFLNVVLCYAQNEINFKHLRVDQGLLSNHVNTVIKDSSGFVWFGTNTGLSRYDGHRFKSYSNRPNDPMSLLNNSIVSMFIGFDKQLWVRTTKGNCVYDAKSDVFIWNVDSILIEKGFVGGQVKKMILRQEGSYVLYDDGDLYYSENEETISWKGNLSGKVTDISMDEIRNMLLLVTDKGEIVALNCKSDQIQQRTKFAFERLVEHSEFHLFVDNLSGIWVYAKNFPFGALYYKTIDMEPTVFRQQGGTYQVNNNYISNIQQMDHSIWLATDHGGINVFDQYTGKTQYLMHNRFNASSLTYNSTTALYKDKDGVMWVGTYKGGVSYYHPDLNYFSLFQHQTGLPESLPFNDINCFVEDKSGIVWVGTNGGGLLRFDPKNYSFQSYLHDPQDERSLGSNVVVSLHIDSEDNLWVGTYHGGLNKFENGGFRRFLHASEDPLTINDNSVWSILHDSRGRFWIGMLSGGVDLLNRSNYQFHRFKMKSATDFNSSYNAKIIEDQRGNVWIGTSSGVAKLTPDDRLTVYNEHTKFFSLTNNVVSDLLEDRRGHIWVATQNGINILSEDKITYLSVNQGLIDNVLVGLVMDNYGDIWATTPKGISRIQYSHEFDGYTIQNYDKSDGLQSSNFNERAIYRLKDGRLLFGGSEGFNIFAPQPIPRGDWKVASVVDFRIAGARTSDDQARSLVQKWLLSAYSGKNMFVPPQIHTFTVVLSDFDFIRNNKSKVQYQLKGLSNEWIDVENLEITLSNLGAKDYTLLIRGLDHNGTYSNPISLLEITVAAPWWRTKWAYFVYLLLTGGVLFFFRKIERMRARTQFNLMQAEEKARHAKEMEGLRTRFFTNVSHEFRTPISLIISPVQKLKREEHNVVKQKYLDIIERNASSLLNLVNELLDLNKIENKKHHLQPTLGDIVLVVRRIAEQFDSIAQTKNITYTIDIHADEWKAHIDFDKLERIILNLLSNAFKFTPHGGHVMLILGFDPDGRQLRLEVSDTGIGVPKDIGHRVFERYYQVDGVSPTGEKGSGLGLAIVKEFVQTMSGEIQFSSDEGKGTTIVVVLPLQDVQHTIAMSDTTVSKGKLRKEKESGIKSENTLRVLIVEDNVDFAFYLMDSLKDYFQVETYYSVEEAWRHLLHFHPDIIVSDLNLPRKSGIDFCREIRANGRTKHIPFVMITAVGDEGKQIEALHLGASDFITKPFSLDVFLSKIKGLVRHQDVVEKLYKRQVDVKLSKSEVVNEDERFVFRMAAVIEQHLQDEHFSVEALASQMNMTRVGLYKKILSITGFTPIEYIRNIRLNKALDLLKNTSMTVSEISYEVGFGTPKQFSKHFKNFYGEVPSSFRK